MLKINQNFLIARLKNSSLGMAVIKLRYSAVVSLLKNRNLSANSSEGPGIFWRIR